LPTLRSIPVEETTEIYAAMGEIAQRGRVFRGYQGEKIIQIAMPQRTTNQPTESESKRADRAILRVSWCRRPMLFG
jgi:hypothetical protein